MRTFSEASRCILSKFYIKPQPFVPAVTVKVGCILSKFYIKPQLYQSCIHADLCCILSKFYIKPQPAGLHAFESGVVSYRNSTSNHNSSSVSMTGVQVVSYRNSTSNHNAGDGYPVASVLYLIEILHQTTTSKGVVYNYSMLYLIEILHQTTTTIGEIFFPR